MLTTQLEREVNWKLVHAAKPQTSSWRAFSNFLPYTVEVHCGRKCSYLFSFAFIKRP